MNIPAIAMNVAVAIPSRLIRLLVGQALHNLNVTHTEIEKTGDIFSRARSLRPQVLILQIDMEDFDFADVCRLLRGANETRNIHIIALSTSMEAERDAIDCGADAFITFPFDEAKLNSLLIASQSDHKKILLVDDSRVIHEQIKGILKNEN